MLTGECDPTSCPSTHRVTHRSRLLHHRDGARLPATPRTTVAVPVARCVAQPRVLPYHTSIRWGPDLPWPGPRMYTHRRELNPLPRFRRPLLYQVSYKCCPISACRRRLRASVTSQMFISVAVTPAGHAGGPPGTRTRIYETQVNARSIRHRDCSVVSLGQ